MKKINKGLILTIIVLVGLTAYLANVERQRKEDKEDIKKACEEYISFADKYSVLPENLQILIETVEENSQTLSEGMEEKKIEEYKKEMKTELEKLMVPNEEIIKIQSTALENILERTNPREVTSKIERKITKISSYEFEGDQVTVTFDSMVKTVTKYLDEQNEEQEKQDSFNTENDEIILQKLDGKWKIVYSNLNYRNNYDYYVEDTMGMY